jgi:hypothetical protein
LWARVSSSKLKVTICPNWGETLKSTKWFIATALAATLIGGVLVGPAAAHKRTITQVYTDVWEDGAVHTQAWLSTETHAGTMKTTLKKRNAAGDWVNIATKKAVYAIGWGYAATFNAVAGQKRCKAVARFTSVNHPTISKSSLVFDC